MSFDHLELDMTEHYEIQYQVFPTVFFYFTVFLCRTEWTHDIKCDS